MLQALTGSAQGDTGVPERFPCKWYQRLYAVVRVVCCVGVSGCHCCVSWACRVSTSAEASTRCAWREALTRIHLPSAHRAFHRNRSVGQGGVQRKWKGCLHRRWPPRPPAAPQQRSCMCHSPSGGGGLRGACRGAMRTLWPDCGGAASAAPAPPGPSPQMPCDSEGETGVAGAGGPRNAWRSGCCGPAAVLLCSLLAPWLMHDATALTTRLCTAGSDQAPVFSAQPHPRRQGSAGSSGENGLSAEQLAAAASGPRHRRTAKYPVGQ
jgi:hypothetical protein